MSPLERISLKAHAKINLTLDILYRRADGYHQVETVMQELKLHDELYLEELPGGDLELSCDCRELPPGEENLALKAAKLAQSLLSQKKGVRIHLVKKIPVAAGLGGGSSDAAAVLKGLNILWRLSLPREELLDLGARLGSDVPFFLYGGTALARGRGERIFPLPSFPRTGVLLVLPEGAGLSSAQVYNSLPLDKIPGRKTTAEFVETLKGEGVSEDELFSRLSQLLSNHLEKAIFSLDERVAGVKEELSLRGWPALVSGSGPTVFALSRDLEGLRKTAEDLSASGYRVILTETKPNPGSP